MKMNEETIERLAYRLIRREIRRFDRTTTDSEVANYVRGVVDLQTQLYEELNRVESKDENRNTDKNSEIVIDKNSEIVIELPKVVPADRNSEVVTKLL